MFSTIFTVAVDGYAALDRASDRRRLLAMAEDRVALHHAVGRPRSLVIVRSPNDVRVGLRDAPTHSAVVFVDCALEMCGDEADLQRCWREIRRVSGATDECADDLFVLTLQRWATVRVALDPRVRWIIAGAPPRSLILEYEAFGKRQTVLADAAEARARIRTKRQGAIS